MLTPRQEMFVDNYLRTFNKTKAAEGLYPATLTRSQLCIRGARLFNNPLVQQAIRLRLDERVVTTNELLDRWAEQCRADYSQYIGEDGTVNVAQIVEDGKSHLIKRIRHTRFGLDIEFYDAQKAQEMLARYFGLFDDSIRVKDAVVVNVRYSDEVDGSPKSGSPPLPQLTMKDDLTDEDYLDLDELDQQEFPDEEDFSEFEEDG